MEYKEETMSSFNNNSGLYRVNEYSSRMYDSDFLKQVDLTGGRVDQSTVHDTSLNLYGYDFTNNVLKKADRQGSKVDTDPRAVFRDGKGNLTKRFFRATDLYVVPTSQKGTGDKTFVASIDNKAYTTFVRDAAGKGGPIRLPNLPGTKGMGRNLGSDAAAGYIQCMTVNHGIKNDGLVYLASSPNDIQDNTSSEIANGSAIGSSQSFELFSSVGSRTVTFNFDVFADYLPYPFTDVKDYCLALKQMNYPTYSSLRVNSPDVVFVYGGIRIRGIPQITFSYATTTKKGIVDKASVSVQIVETENIVNGRAKI